MTTDIRWWKARCSCFLALTLLLGMLTLTGCTRSAPKLEPLPPDAVLLAFGDSITFGTGATLAESYPVLLAEVIGHTVINAGVPGETTAEGLARLSEALDRYHPALVILCLGGNDFLRGLDEQKAADNIREMLRLARSKGVGVVLLGVPKFGINPSPPPFYRQLAREFDVPYNGAILKKILTTNSLKADYIHPNAAGYRLLAGSIADLLKKSGAL